MNAHTPLRGALPRLLAMALATLAINLIDGTASAAPPAADALYAAGTKAEAAGDLRLAARNYQQAAAAGHVDAQYNLAYAYQNGEGVTRDPVAAQRWYASAANAGHRRAMRQLGLMYLQEEGVPQNGPLARKWLTAGAAKGDAKSNNALAYMYDNGVGVPVDKCAARDWYLKAERAGDTSGEVFLGIIYAAGQCGEADWGLARRYFQSGANHGDKLGKMHLAYLTKLENQQRAAHGGIDMNAVVAAFIEGMNAEPPDNSAAEFEIDTAMEARKRGIEENCRLNGVGC